MRYRCAVAIAINAGRARVRGVTEAVSHSGVFAALDGDLVSRQLVTVEVELPGEPVFTTHAMVVFSRKPSGGQRAGAGLKFFGLDRETLGRWGRFVEGARDRERAAPQVVLAAKRGPHAAVVLRVRPDGVDSLLEVYTRDLAEGGIFVESDQPLLIGSRSPAHRAFAPRASDSG